MWPMNNAALHVELGRLTAQLAAERAEIERLRAENDYLANCLERIGSTIIEALKTHDAMGEARRE